MNISKIQSEKIKILIIGSGIIGKFNAVELENFGFDITIVDQNEFINSSNAALGILMGKIYQKRTGRSWSLREKSLELWPTWLQLLQKYNPQLIIEKPLIQLTTDNFKFQKLVQFAKKYPYDNFEIVDKNSTKLNQIYEIFKNNNLKGIISNEDGRINPIMLLGTLSKLIKEKKIKTFNDRIVKVSKKNKKWVSKLQTGEIITSDIVILCNSLDSLKLINPNDYDIKLKPVLGQAIEIFCDDDKINFLSLPKQLNINGKNLIPLSKHKIIIGSTNEYNIEPEDNCINDLLDFLEEKPSWLKKNQINL